MSTLEPHRGSQTIVTFGLSLKFDGLAIGFEMFDCGSMVLSGFVEIHYTKAR